MTPWVGTPWIPGITACGRYGWRPLRPSCVAVVSCVWQLLLDFDVAVSAVCRLRQGRLCCVRDCALPMVGRWPRPQLLHCCCVYIPCTVVVLEQPASDSGIAGWQLQAALVGGPCCWRQLQTGWSVAGWCCRLLCSSSTAGQLKLSSTCYHTQQFVFLLKTAEGCIAGRPCGIMPRSSCICSSCHGAPAASMGSSSGSSSRQVCHWSQQPCQLPPAFLLLRRSATATWCGFNQGSRKCASWVAGHMSVW